MKYNCNAILSRLHSEDLTPVLFFLSVFVSLVFLLLQNSLVFLSVFCLFFRAFKGFALREGSLVFLRFSLVFSKRPKEKKDRDNISNDLEGWKGLGSEAWC